MPSMPKMPSSLKRTGKGEADPGSPGSSPTKKCACLPAAPPAPPQLAMPTDPTAFCLPPLPSHASVPGHGRGFMSSVKIPGRKRKDDDEDDEEEEDEGGSSGRGSKDGSKRCALSPATGHPPCRGSHGDQQPIACSALVHGLLPLRLAPAGAS